MSRGAEALVDSHFHLDRFPAEERPHILARAAAAGVGFAVTIGTRLSEAASTRALARDAAGGPVRISCAIGTHPEYAHEEVVPDPEALAARVRAAPEIVAIGETGLDFVVGGAPREAQEASFRAHIRAARLAGVPLVIHARGADEAIAAVLREETDTGGPFAFVLHCFASGAALAEAGLVLGGYVSFSGILTFPKAPELREIARAIPAERLLVETDAPFLAPVPHRGRRNEPAHLVHTAALLAELRGLPPDSLARLTTANFFRLFRRADTAAPAS